jgi:hypothetical protein
MPGICGDMVGDWPRKSPCFLLAGDVVGDRPGKSPCFLLAGDMAENVPMMSPLNWSFAKMYCCSVSIGSRSPIRFRHFPKSF